MNQQIIYSTDDGIAIIIPANCELTIEEIAVKDVPLGKQYKIVNDSDIPTDRTFRDAWELVDGQIVVNETKKQAIIDAQQAPIIAKESAISKLAALGLTQEEIKALVG